MTAWSLLQEITAAADCRSVMAGWILIDALRQQPNPRGTPFSHPARARCP
jgi:hypothetical protein